MGLFQDYLAHGCAVIPERKSVPMVKWSGYVTGCLTITSRDAEAWDNIKGVNYGLLCGEPSGIIAVDIDSDDVAEEVYRLAGQTLVRKVGSKGLTAFYRYSGEVNKVWRRGGDTMVELLSSGRKTTIPPSQHNKTGKPYLWQERPLLGIPVNELPELDGAFIEAMDSMFPQRVQQHVVPRYTDDYDKVALEEAQEMLQFLDPDMGYYDWVTVGMGLCAEFGDAAFQSWDGWSRSGSKYKPAGMWNKWRSFHGSGVSIASVIYMAKQAGWYPVSNDSGVKGVKQPWEDIDISDYMAGKSKEIRGWTVETLIEKAGNVGWLDRMPEGSLKLISEWMTSSALYPQPVLSVANAIAGLGALMGHRFQTETGARSNMMVIGLAPSGSGKDHPIRCMQRLMYDCGLEKMVGGAPASGPGVISTVKKAGGRKLLQIDEIGRILGAINAEKASGYEKQILTELMMIFSAANGVYTGREYANQEDRPTVTIDQPCLSVYGATVADNLYDAITSRDAIDGFLSRWLLFQVPTGYVKRRPKQERRRLEVTESMLELIQGIERTPVSDSPYAFGIKPKEVAFSLKADELFYRYWDQIDERKEQEDGVAALLARMPEHIAKLALIVWHGSGESEIRADHMQWAIDVVEFCVANSVQVAREYITEGSFDKQTKRLHRYIAEAGKSGISRTHVHRKFGNLKARDLSESLTKLAESGLINIERNGRKERYFSVEND